MKTIALRCLLMAAALGATGEGPTFGQDVPEARPVPRPGLSITRWAREPMVQDPVALSVDDRGRVFVVETARRSTVDIDIRSHQSWILDDLANQSVEDLRRFFRAKMAPERSTENAGWLRDYNGDGSHDWRDLTAVRERVRRLEDVGGVGRADRAQVFAEGFNEEINGVIAGVMPWGKDVFVTIYPDLWRLRDTDDDGVADLKETVFRGFGVHAAFDGHDLHGLIVGPDGKIYFSCGDNGFSVVNKEGRRLHHPNTGGVLRMNPDGSELEVFATGLRNPQEIAFDDYGNLFSVDNDGDLEDERERFVYITEGSDSGWRLHWQFRDPGWARFTRQPNYNPWTAERMWVPQFPGQPAHITPPLSNYSVGPGGFVYNPGTALNSAYRGHFFLVQFPVQKVTAFRVLPKGAAFEMEGEHVFLSGMMTSAVNFGPDGAMYVADWDGLWAPNEKGAIWVIDDPRSDLVAARREVRRLLAEGMTGRSTAELAALLGHADRRIRQRAQFELVRREEASTLRAVAGRRAAAQLARIHALWGLDQLRRPLPISALPLADPDLEIRAQAARVAGDLRLRPAVPRLIGLLDDRSPRVQFHAAQALGKIGDPRAVRGLADLLERNNDADAFLRHAAVFGLAGAAESATLAGFAGHASAAVRLGAVVALRRQKSPRVAAFLADASAAARREVVRAIHDDDGIPEALPRIAALTEGFDADTEEAVARRALNANLRVGDEVTANRLLQVALDRSQPIAWRIEAVGCLGSWDRRPLVDRVEGLVRVPGPRVDGFGDRLVRENLDALLEKADAAFAQAVTAVVLENRIEADPKVFAEWVQSAQQSIGVRAQSLRFLAQRGSDLLGTVLPLALRVTEPELRQVAMEILAGRDPDAFIAFLREQESGLSVRERQVSLRLMGGLRRPAVVWYLGDQWERLAESKLQAELELDLIEACRGIDDAGIKMRLDGHDKKRPGATQLEKLRPMLTGGDAAAGRDLFRNHVNAQCVRCHEAGGEGYQAGPVLKGIGARATPEYLLEALLEPSARIAPGFETVTITRKDGDVVDGLLLREAGDELVLRLGSGEIQRISGNNIERRLARTVSSMPPMGEVLTPLELRDLVAYLQTLK